MRGAPPRDPERAAGYFFQAANLGHDMAQFLLGLAFYTGTGVAPDRIEAAHWVLRSAKQGNEMADNYLQAHDGLADLAKREMAEAHRRAPAAAMDEASCELDAEGGPFPRLNPPNRLACSSRGLDEDAVDGARTIDAEEVGVLRVDRIRQAGDRLRDRILFGVAVFDHQIVASPQNRIDMLAETRELTVEILDQKAWSCQLSV